MTVIEKHRIIKESWVFGVCDNCAHNPEEVKMIKEQIISGDPDGKYKSDSEIWVCQKCGYARKL